MRYRDDAQRGSVLVMGMILVTTLATLSLIFASRITMNERRLEIDIAENQATELAQSALDWNLARLWSEFEQSFQNYKIDPSAKKPHEFLAEVLRPRGILPEYPMDDPGLAPSYTAKKYDVLAYDKDNPPVKKWQDVEEYWEDFGPGQIQLSTSLLKQEVGKTTIEVKVWARIEDPRVMGRFVQRQVRRIVNLNADGFDEIKASRVFDFAYFVNNFGWMWGSTIAIQGSVGSNANLSFKSGPLVNGNLYAAANPYLGAAGAVLDGFPKSDTLLNYRTKGNGNPLFRPTNPSYSEDINNNGVLEANEDVNGNGVLDFKDYALGYPGSTTGKPPEILTAQDPLDMPYLGDLSYFKNKAEQFVRPVNYTIGELGGDLGGIVKQLKAPGLDPTNPANYNILVDQTYGFRANENGMLSKVNGAAIVTEPTAIKIDEEIQTRNGNLALIGTAAQPIVIVGPVVVTNDLVIKGVIKGQGTFFVGRNTHVVGDLTYSDLPQWQQNDPNFDAVTAPSNKAKDLVGFATKGSIIMGQYYRNDDHWNTAKDTYFKTGFQDDKVQSYQVDPTDKEIGYVTGNYNSDPSKPMFHGDYTAEVPDTAEGREGEYRKRYRDAAQAELINLRYYESSFSNEYIQSIALARPEKVQGVFYTNHLIGGRVGHNNNGITFFGAMVARDEGIIFNKKFDLIYDPRASESDPSSSVKINLPPSNEPGTGNITGVSFERLSWEIMAPGQYWSKNLQEH